ncbi:MAG: hypothetical protein IT424_03075 [Pirellulales bacterium]|nr:hypothetical protein [Pirellulales bacterium]
MRLTLRTLLAYMDDVLDPADQEELGRKIESSAFATELIHRSRDAVRRLRLSAPDVLAGADDDIHGSDNSYDANTVAEYLDNVLPAEAVAEFERSCLEAGAGADMLLAEAASCHHILTMVLGEPAEVDSDLRQRMYGLSQSPAAGQQLRVEPAHAPAASQPVAPAAVPLSTVVTVSSPLAAPGRYIDDEDDEEESEVPDYIRAAARQRRRNRQLAGAFVVALLLGGLATWYFWPTGEVVEPEAIAALGGTDHVIQAPEVGSTEPSSESATSDVAAAPPSAAEPGDPYSEAPAFVPGPSVATTTPTQEAPAGAPTATAPGGEAAAADAAAATGDDAAAGTTVMTPALETPATEAAAGGPQEGIGDAATGAASGAAGSAAAVAGGESTASASTPLLPPEPPMSPDGERAGPAEPATPGPGLIADSPPAPPTAPADEAGGPPAEPPATGAAAAAKPVGLYLGNNDMLLRRDSAGAWLRMPPRTPLTNGEQLLALPAFRTLVVLADVNAYLTGGAQIELAPAEAVPGGAADVALHIPFGQVIFNAGLNGNRIALSLVDQERVIQLDPSSSLAIQVRRVFEPGAATQRTPAPAEVGWFLTSGQAAVGDGEKIAAPAMWTTVAGEDSRPEPIEQVPAWVDRDPLSTLERGARDRVAEALLANEPVNLKLLELSDKTGLGRRIEVRTLAERCGTYVGVFDPIVRALGDVEQKAYWKAQIESLRDAIARDPSSAEAIGAAFAIERGEQAAGDLMEMLLGFDQAAIGTTREEVKNGSLLRLLRWMENDDLVYRVLALYNVNEITGTNNLGGYRPEHTAQQRDREMRFYWQAFDNGDLIRK